MSNQKTGIEKLRAMVRYFDYQNEEFNSRFTIGQLINIYDHAMEHEELPEFADSWSPENVRKAIEP